MGDSPSAATETAGSAIGAFSGADAKVTISDVAAASGVSKGTVSRALNRYPDISEATRRKVASAAARLGYIPSAHAKALKTGIVSAVGMILSMDYENAHRPFLSDFIDGISSTLGARGWTLSVATASSHEAAAEAHQRLLDERKVDGFILPRTMTEDPRVALLRGRGAPFVMFGRTGDMAGCAYFDIAGEDAMGEAVRRFAGQGHEVIGYIGGGEAYYYQGLREAGFREAMVQIGRAPDLAVMAAGAMTRAGGREAAARFLEAETPPTAIVCATDRAALGAMEAIGARGLTVGREVSVIGYDGVPEAEYASPPLTTYAVDMREAGVRLATLLLRRIQGEAPDALRELRTATLVERCSDGPPVLTSAALAQRLKSQR